MTWCEFKINPQPKSRLTFQGRFTQRAKKYYDYCNALQLLAKGVTIKETVDLVFVMPMPQSWSKKKKEAMMNKPHQQRPDLDNLIKAVLDALCKEDKHIHKIQAMKIWGSCGLIGMKTQ